VSLLPSIAPVKDATFAVISSFVHKSRALEMERQEINHEI